MASRGEGVVLRITSLGSAKHFDWLVSQREVGETAGTVDGEIGGGGGGGGERIKSVREVLIGGDNRIQCE